MAGISGYEKENRFVPTPKINVLLDRKTLQECWAGEVVYSGAPPKDVEQELLASLDVLARTKSDTPANDAAFARHEKAEERWKF
jgi:hypothetical protein